MFKKNSKRADLSLSTNAIVILILAITILGLGLTFVRGLFKQAESKITEVTSSTELANPPTRDNPITLTPSQVNLRASEQKKVVLAFLNNLEGDKKCQLTIYTNNRKDVMLSDAAGIQNLALYSKSLNPIKQDGINVWTIAIDGQKNTNTKPDTQVLTASMCCADSDATACAATDKQFTRDLIITVTP